MRFIAEHGQKTPDKPFFLYTAYTAAHWPMHALEADIAKYRGKYDAGYDAIRKARFERMKQLGLVDPDWQFTADRRRLGRREEQGLGGPLHGGLRGDDRLAWTRASAASSSS